jgi:DNA-binding phage protein
MPKVTREQLQSYLEDALSDAETAKVEQALRDSESLQKMLRALMQERDRGEHSIGAIWCRERLSCMSREQLGSYLLQVLDPGLQDYIDFHLQTIACSFCQANLADLRSLHQEPVPKAKERRRRFFESSAGYLQACRPNKA